MSKFTAPLGTCIGKLNVYAAAPAALVLMDPDTRQVIRLNEEGMVALEELLKEWRTIEKEKPRLAAQEVKEF